MSVSTPDSGFDAEVLYQKLLAQMKADWSQLGAAAHLVGVASSGVWVAERLRQDMGLSAPIGVVSSSMHRDDFAQRGLAASALQTTLPFEVDGATVVLVDDVLHTGRTLRAVINELFDYGRPARVALAVLVDRGEHQLPVAADWCGQRSAMASDTVLNLSRDDQGQFAFEVEGA